MPPPQDTYIYAFCGVLAVAGGAIVIMCGDSIVNMALGFLGAAMVAQGVMNMLVTDFMTKELDETLKIDEYYMYYVAAIAVILYLLRSFGVCCREGSAPNAAAPVRAAPPPKKGKVAPSRSPPGRGVPGKRMY